MKMRIATTMLLLSLLLSAGALAAQVTRIAVLHVPGMTCPTCPITVRTALKRVPGVEKVSVDYPARTVSVAYDAGRTDVAALLKATADAGYPAKTEKQVKP